MFMKKGKKRHFIQENVFLTFCITWQSNLNLYKSWHANENFKIIPFFALFDDFIHSQDVEDVSFSDVDNPDVTN